VAHLAHHGDFGRSQLQRAIGFFHGIGRIGVDPAQLLQKIHMKKRAAKLAVGNAFEAHVFLKLDDFAYRPILHQTQLFGVDLALGELITGIEQVFGTQKAADLIGAENLVSRCSHGNRALEKG